ncbi:MAG: alpha-glucosidase [Promethearchaeota archaeon]
MLRLAQSSNRFDVYFQQTVVFHHRNDETSISLGISTPKVKQQEGFFTFKEKIQNRAPMNRFSVKMNTEEVIEVHFSNTTTYEAVIVRFEVRQPKTDDEYLTLNLTSKTVGINRTWIRLPSHENENVFGCGEQSSQFCLNGKKIPLWVQESGVGREGFQKKAVQMSVKKGVSPFPQPTFVGFADNVNYSCHVETSAYAEFEFHKIGKKGAYHELYFWDLPRRLTLHLGKTPIDVISKLSAMLGRQPPLSEWIFDGMWIAMEAKDGLDKMRARLTKFLDAGVKVGAIWSHDWDKIDPSDLLVFVKEIRKQGIRYLGYFNCFLGFQSELYGEVPEKHHFVHTKYDTEYVFHGSGDSGNDVVMYDLTNPACFDWVKSIIKKKLIKNGGLGGWMSDYGEFLPLDAALHSEEDPALVHNKYPVLFAKANYEAIQELGLEKEVTFFSRAGYTGTSCYSPLLWAGDQFTSWDRLKGIGSVIPAALSAGVSGIGYHHSDIGGFANIKRIKRTKELLLRWTELCAFSLIMRSHEGLRPGDNWQSDSDDETLAHLARMTQIHVMLKPYLQHCAEEYQETGIPVIRAPVLYFPRDPKAALIDDQYLLGRDMWVAPILRVGETQKTISLPEGGWVHLWTRLGFTKGTVKIEVPMGYPAVFYRKESKFRELFEEINDNFGTRA